MSFKFDEEKIPIRECGLSEVVTARLAKCGCETLGDVIKIPKIIIYNLKDITPELVKEIEDTLQLFSLYFDKNKCGSDYPCDYRKMNLSGYAHNRLLCGRIYREYYLKFITEEELSSIEGMGKKTLAEIRSWMNERGICFRKRSCMS